MSLQQSHIGRVGACALCYKAEGRTRFLASGRERTGQRNIFSEHQQNQNYFRRGPYIYEFFEQRSPRHPKSGRPKVCSSSNEQAKATDEQFRTDLKSMSANWPTSRLACLTHPDTLVRISK
jgi:hypothetical protein